MTTVICPYCFARASAVKLPYRCLMTSGGVRGARPCDPERDDIWAGFVGPGQPPAALMRGPVFTPARSPIAALRVRSGGASSTACPDCGVTSTLRVCRMCHNDLPSDYCNQDSRIIALVGAKASGKSTYVSVLVNELNHRVGLAYEASLAAMGKSTQDRDSEMAQDLYERLRLPDATRPAALGFNDPLLYRLSLPRRGRLGAGSRHTALVFFDAAGEDLADAEAMDRYTRYLGAADGIILLVDPLQLGSVRDQLPPGEGPPLPAMETRPQQIAAGVATQLRAHGRGGSGGRVSTPIAVAVTKSDMLRPLLGPHSPLLRSAQHTGGAFDAADRIAVHEEVRALMADWDSGALHRQLERDFQHLSLFALSALGAPPPPEAPADVPKSGPQPLRVEDPLLWLLSRRGLLPVREPRKGEAK